MKQEIGIDLNGSSLSLGAIYPMLLFYITYYKVLSKGYNEFLQ